jgi:hypothetical protein
MAKYIDPDGKRAIRLNTNIDIMDKSTIAKNMILEKMFILDLNMLLLRIDLKKI